MCFVLPEGTPTPSGHHISGHTTRLHSSRSPGRGGCPQRLSQQTGLRVPHGLCATGTTEQGGLNAQARVPAAPSPDECLPEA